MIRFLHTSDWQLGMTRHFFTEGVQERFSQARFDAIRRLGQVARDEQCRFMVVCGDAFESNQVDRKTVIRALEALKEVIVPVYILPGNHDPLDAASVYHSAAFEERKPAHVHIVEDSEPVQCTPGLELVGAPWYSKRVVANPLEELLNGVSPAGTMTRIVLAHGGVDVLAPDQEAAGVIPVAKVEQAISEGKLHYLALGDRHSFTRVAGSDRICYSGTPEPTDFTETKSGSAVIVDLDRYQVRIEEVSIGRWRFLERRQVELNTMDDVDTLRRELEEIEGKERTVVKLYLVGTLSLSLRARLDEYLEILREAFAAVEVRERELVVIPEDVDFADVALSGFAEKAVRRLRDMSEMQDDGGVAARDALMLLLRLTREEP